MKYGDTNRIKAADLAGGSTLYRINNAGGVPYSIVEEADGFESLSCERKDEWTLFAYNRVEAVRWYLPQIKPPRDGLTGIGKFVNELCE